MNIPALPLDDDVTTGAEALARVRRLRPAPKMQVVRMPGRVDHRDPVPARDPTDFELAVALFALRVFSNDDERDNKKNQAEISRRIAAAVCLLWGCTKEDLCSLRRTKEIIQPRFVAIALICRLTEYSLPQVGRFFGDRDHTTILNAKRKMEPTVRIIESRVSHDAIPEDWVEEAYLEIVREG